MRILVSLFSYIMRNRLIALILSFLLAASAAAQQSSQSSSNAASAGKSSGSDSVAVDKPHDYTQESFVIEKLNARYRFEADGTGRKELIARIRVQSEAGVQQWGQLQLGYNSANESMEIAYVRVIKEDGSVVKAGSDDIQDLSAPVEHEAPVYTDYRQKHVTVPG